MMTTKPNGAGRAERVPERSIAPEQVHTRGSACATTAHRRATRRRVVLRAVASRGTPLRRHRAPGPTASRWGAGSAAGEWSRHLAELRSDVALRGVVDEVPRHDGGGQRVL